MSRVMLLVVGLTLAFDAGQGARARAQSGSSSPVEVKFDHALICTDDLASMQQAFADVGLKPDYGGHHGQAPTHMAQLGFDDGTYIGIEAPLKPPAQGILRADLMNGGAGACGWAAQTSDLKADLDRVSRLGVTVGAIESASRKRPDGTLAQWQDAGMGPGEPGVMLPFLMQDITPHSDRVRTSASTRGTGLTGVAMVVLGVKDLNAGIALFRRVYNWRAPKVENHPEFGARLAYFEGTPVILAAPLGHAWLSDRLARFGPLPAAFLLGTSDFKAAAEHFSLTGSTTWFNWKVSWFDAQKLHRIRLGIAGH
jgi:Glyoxalase-like domain